jgi:hypothetical protein
VSGKHGLQWYTVGKTLYYLDSSEIKPSDKVVGFDMVNHTIFVSKHSRMEHFFIQRVEPSFLKEGRLSDLPFFMIPSERIGNGCSMEPPFKIN